MIINKTIANYKLEKAENLIQFIKDNPLNLGSASLARIAELTNSKRENNAAYYTNKFIVNEIFKNQCDTIRTNHVIASFLVWGNEKEKIGVNIEFTEEGLSFEAGERSPLARLYDNNGW